MYDDLSFGGGWHAAPQLRGWPAASQLGSWWPTARPLGGMWHAAWAGQLPRGECATGSLSYILSVVRVSFLFFFLFKITLNEPKLSFDSEDSRLKKIKKTYGQEPRKSSTQNQFNIAVPFSY